MDAALPTTFFLISIAFLRTISKPRSAPQKSAFASSFSSSKHPPSLIVAVEGIAAAVTSTAAALRGSDTDASEYAGTSNESGDDQLKLDVVTDNISYSHLLKSGVFYNAISEETPSYKPLSPKGVYTCSFDPLDGSSVVGANFSIGGIYAVWDKRDTLVGTSGRELLLSAVAVYGSRTTLFIGIKGDDHVKEFTLVNNKWKCTAESVVLSAKPTHKTFAFGNLRATKDSPDYDRLLNYYLTNRYTLRYTGGMVPDVMHILSKRGGVFTNCSSPTAKAKLRFLYEIASIALLVETAGGKAVDESGRNMLDAVCTDNDMRVGGCIGSAAEVDTFVTYLCPKKAKELEIEKTDEELAKETEERLRNGESIESIFR
jgi:sedoheptulose-bisphosphatase